MCGSVCGLDCWVNMVRMVHCWTTLVLAAFLDRACRKSSWLLAYLAEKASLCCAPGPGIPGSGLGSLAGSGLGVAPAKQRVDSDERQLGPGCVRGVLRFRSLPIAVGIGVM